MILTTVNNMSTNTDNEFKQCISCDLHLPEDQVARVGARLLQALISRVLLKHNLPNAWDASNKDAELHNARVKIWVNHPGKAFDEITEALEMCGLKGHAVVEIRDSFDKN